MHCNVCWSLGLYFHGREQRTEAHQCKYWIAQPDEKRDVEIKLSEFDSMHNENDTSCKRAEEVRFSSRKIHSINCRTFEWNRTETLSGRFSFLMASAGYSSIHTKIERHLIYLSCFCVSVKYEFTFHPDFSMLDFHNSIPERHLQTNTFASYFEAIEMVGEHNQEIQIIVPEYILCTFYKCTE